MRLIVLLTVVACASSAAAAGGPEDVFTSLGAEYGSETRPLLLKYCNDCHATAEPAGELDLERFTTIKAVRDGATSWIKVAEMLDDGQMPPEDAAQPTAEERTRLRDWVKRYLDAEARASAGDPGPVPLRRLSNAEYTYTVRDLTGVNLDPAREFPTDGAAGEGFTNAASALVMSPALMTKYFDAGKDIARHAVLLPDGFRFSESDTRRDHTEELLAEIRSLYSRYADADGATEVNLQGIKFATNAGGRLPVERYLAALLEEREALHSGETTIATVAAARRLSPRYLGSLDQLLKSDDPSPLLETLRARWKDARPEDAPALAASIARWQHSLSTFQNVGHMRPWVVDADPVTTRQEIRVAIPADAAGEVVLRLFTGDAGNGNENDIAVWERPRFVADGRPDILLKDLRTLAASFAVHRENVVQSTVPALDAAAEFLDANGGTTVDALAAERGIDKNVLHGWFNVLGIGSSAVDDLKLFAERTEAAGEYDFIQGWSHGELPSIVANASDKHVRIPGNVKPHGVAVHPSPELAAGIGWKSPVAGDVRLSGAVTHAHPECGNGVAWTLELRRGGMRRRLASGVAAGGSPVAFGPVDANAVREGDLVVLLIGARDANHSCDLTDVELSVAQGETNWNLSEDLGARILEGNPLGDGHGNAGVWHFFSESDRNRNGFVLPEGSLLAKWQAARSGEDQQAIATQLQHLLVDGPASDTPAADAELYRSLRSFGGPLLAGDSASTAETSSTDAAWGLDSAAFGTHPDGSSIESASLCVQAPASIEVRVPAELVAGTTFVASGVLHTPSGQEGSVQLQASIAGSSPDGDSKRATNELHADLPVLVAEGSDARATFAAGIDEFRRWFPIALCYPKIVPTDEVITLTLHHREDEPLSRLMLSDDERVQLDRMWHELRFVSQDALTIVDAFAQLLEYASQDGDPSVFEPLRKPIEEKAAAFRAALVEAEPRHVEALVEFASRVYRRPLSDAEAQSLRDLYRQLRDEELSHDAAFRLTLARLFASPAFLYRLETAPDGSEAGPVSDGELASRLSYFLWSSLPDDELRQAASAGKLHDPDEIAAQARRMLTDDRIRRLATEFACQWLQIYELDALDEKSERHFPEFAGIRDDLYEEPIRFFTDMFQQDRSILDLLDARHTFLNEDLAAHYGIPGVTGPEWRRVEDVRRFGRGGVLGFGATLAKHSGASRTSPTLRGAWISDALLGEKLPPPPPDIPELPGEEAATQLSVRELVEKHSSDPRCAGCHVRVDPFGFALEQFDSIGRFRDQDAAGRSFDLRSKLRDGTVIEGISGVRDHLLHARREVVVKQFCRKLLGYALGRSVRLSDAPLLEAMQQRLKEEDYRFSVAVEMIVRSPQFREIRGRDAEIAEVAP